MLHVLSLKATLQLTCTQNKTANMLVKSVKLLKKEQFVLLFYHLLPVEGVYTQAMLKWMDSPPKHSSSNCM